MSERAEAESLGVESVRRTAPAARSLAKAAARLFANQGFDATSVRQIVEAAGVAKPTLYYYFGSKEGLARAIVQEPLGLLVEQIRRIVSSEPDPIHALERVIEAHYAYCREDADRARFLYATIFGPPGSNPANLMACEKHDLSGLTEAATRRLVEAGIVLADRLDDFNAMVRGVIVVPMLGFLYGDKPLGPGLARALVHGLLVGFDGRKLPEPTR
ncbi:HTH-type transcriptional repressor KstR2 [Aquisphaera giovannonii]|uniref:HTH-type transcriptional repressor KstR2 n=1 Tax=Aquisphaera giovannonii TaxID=406548 RepID=A0A5B9VZ14_9BACT|nr:TetR/AcrR family transcriptional regulator [Aquisphaera giovannonii]QEH33572.1 HTH-type transcriptional repressor KstR2 [Aquisphaera giovannonii]